MNKFISLLLTLSCLLVGSFLNGAAAQNCPANLLANPGFENGLPGWTVTGDAILGTDPHSGTYSVQLGGNGFASIGQVLPAQPGTGYSAHFWVKEAGTDYRTVELRFLNASWMALPGSVVKQFNNTAYQQQSLSGIAPTGTAYVYVIALKDGGSSIEVDDIELCEDNSGLPDLTLDNLTIFTNPVQQGAIFFATNHFKNIGTDTAFSVSTKVYASPTPSLGGNEVLLFTNFNSQVIPGVDIIHSQGSIFIPAAMPLGDYYLIVVTDEANEITESNENNNMLVSSSTFTVTNIPSCAITPTISNIHCNDNGTPTNPADDRFSFTLTATNPAQSTGYQVFIPQTSQAFQGTYGSPLTIQNILISTGNLTLNLTDDVTGSCSESVAVTAPAPCSNGGGGTDPDLVPQNLSLSANTVQQGAPLGINFDAVNTGGAIPSGQLPFLAQMYLSTDNSLSANDIKVGPGAQIGPGNQSSTGGAVPPSTPVGQYFVLVKLDDANTVAESNENNNVGVAPQQVTVTAGGGGSGIDLELYLTQLTPNPAQWSSYEVVATIHNIGGVAATGVKVKFAKPNGVVYTGGNEFTLSQGSFNAFGDEVWTVGTIPAGGSAMLEVNYFLLQNGAPDAYAQVTAADQQDADSTPNNGTPPTPNEDDEDSTGGSGPPNLTPDLTIADLQITNSPVNAGQVLNYNFDASNIGTGAVPGNFTIKSYLSTDNVLSANDIQDGIVSTGNYGAGFSLQNVPGASTIPANLAAGQYYLFVKIDADGVVAESNENNNVVTQPFTVTGGGGGNSCSFTTYHTPPGPNPLNISFGRLLQLQETPNGYTVAQDFGMNPTGSNPAPFDTYQLDLEGNLVSAFQSPFVPTVDVEMQSVGGDNVEMTFNLSPDLPAGTVVTIDLDYPNPPASVYPSGQALRTSWGYAFGVGIVDLSLSPNIVNRIYMTDHVGQNVTWAELPDPAFYGGPGRIFEGPDGSLFSEWLTSGNFSLFVIPADGSTPWQERVASDTPSSSWKDTDVSYDGNFVYTMKWDNAQTFVAKYGVSDGILYGIDLTALKTSTLPNGHRFTWARGIEPTPDGGLLVSLRADEVTTPSAPDLEVLAKYDATGNLVWKLELPDPGFELTPVGETSDGGVLFAGRTDVGVSPAQTVFLKTTAEGMLTPECGGGTLQPDLTVTAFTPSPASGTAGASISLAYSLANIGQANSGAFQTSYIISTDATVSTDDQFLGGASFGNGLATGATTTYQGFATVPSNLAPGNYYLIVIANYFNPTTESDFTNNALAVPFTITGGGGNPDCNAINITHAPGQITIAGAVAPHVLIKVFKPNWTVAFECLDGTCTNPLVVSGLSTGTHHIQIKLLNASWGEICHRDEDVNVSSFGGGGGTALKINDDDRQRLAFDNIYPNPAQYFVTLAIFSKEDQTATLDFYTQQGQLQHTMETLLEKGRNEVKLDVSEWKSGAYNVIGLPLAPSKGGGIGMPAYGRFLKVWE